MSYPGTLIGSAVVVLPNRDIIIAAKSEITPLNTINATTILMRTDSLGRILWSKNYPGLYYAQGYEPYSWDYADLTLTPDGYLVCATFTGIDSSRISDGNLAYVFKTDLAGNLIWSKAYMPLSGVPRSTAAYITNDISGGNLISGWTGDPSSNTNLIFKTDTSGAVVWAKTYNDKTNSSNGPGNNSMIIPAKKGGYIIGSQINFLKNYLSDYQVIKADDSGNVIWSKNFGSTEWEGLYSVCELPDESIYVFGNGSTQSYGTIQKLDKNGNLLWSKEYTFSDFFVMGLALYDPVKGEFNVPIYTHGQSVPFGTGLLRLDTSGNVLLLRRYQRSTFTQYYYTTHNFVQLPSNEFLLATSLSQNFSSGIYLIKMDKNFNIGGCTVTDSTKLKVQSYSVAMHDTGNMVANNVTMKVINGGKATNGGMQNNVLCPPFIVSFGYKPVCFGNILKFTDSSYYDPKSWHWNFGDGSVSSLQNPVHQYNASGTYKITLTASNGTDTASATKMIVVKILNNLFRIDTFICAADSIVLNAQDSGATYSWNTGNSSQTQPADTGTYWVKISKGICFQTDTFHVKPLINPKINLGHDTTICTGDTLTLNAGYAATTWSTGVTASAIRVVDAGTYWATLKGKTCIATDTIKVSVPNIVANIGSYHTSCNKSLILNPGPDTNATYRWSTGDTTETITVTQSGKYWIQVSKKGCRVSDTAHVVMGALRGQNTLPKDTFLCSGISLPIDLRNRGATNAIWNDNVSGLKRTITKTGVYIVTLSTSTCKEKDSISVTIDTTHFKIGSQLCQGSPYLLYGPSWKGAKYLWNTGSKNNIIVIASPGIYWLSVQYGKCPVSDTISVVIDSPLVVNLGGNKSLCDTSLALSAGKNDHATYLWSNGDTGTFINVDTSGKYWVRVENTSGCMASDTSTITLKKSPVFVSDNLKDITFCNDTGALILDAGAAYKYLWKPGGDTTRKISVTDSGVYTIQITGADRCTTSKSAKVSIDCSPHLYVPNAFSPDSNVVNDIFKAYGVNIASFSMKIYNRWGEKIYSCNDINLGWNGRFKNALCNSGIYIYIINYTTDEAPTKGIKKVGNLYLMR